MSCPTTRKIAYVIGCAGFRNVWPANLRRPLLGPPPVSQRPRTGPQRLPRPAQPLRVCLDVRDAASTSRSRAAAVGRSVRPLDTTSGPASGCHWTPHTVGAKRAACSRPCEVRASSTVPGALRRRCRCSTAPPGVGTAPPTEQRVDGAARSTPPSGRPLSCPPGPARRPRRRRPRPAGGRGKSPGSARHPRQPPGSGPSFAPSHGTVVSSFAPIVPPRTSSPAYAVRSPGRASPAYGRHTRCSTPASVSHPPTQAGGQLSWCWTTRTRATASDPTKPARGRPTSYASRRSTRPRAASPWTRS